MVSFELNPKGYQNWARNVEYDALARISFVNCNFEKVYFAGKGVGSCNFQNCIFNHFNARKGTFSTCCFENCKITDSDMTKAEFYDTHFQNCEFLAVDLAASDFEKCEFKGTRFFKSNLDFIGVEDVKVLKSKEWVEIEDLSSFKKHLEE